MTTFSLTAFFIWFGTMLCLFAVLTPVLEKRQPGSTACFSLGMLISSVAAGYFFGVPK